MRDNTGTRPTSKGGPIPYRNSKPFTPQTAAAQNARDQPGQAVSSHEPFPIATTNSPIHNTPTTTTHLTGRALVSLGAGSTGT